jgi:hypothetical protein
MRELSPWRHVVAPHMADGFRAIRGEFRLTALPDGRTRLAGSTWYVLRILPRSYWSRWADGFVRTIHLRVLEHIRREAEAEWAGVPRVSSRGTCPVCGERRPVALIAHATPRKQW